MSEFQPQTEDLGWHAYQPSWPGALFLSFLLGAIYGWQSYRRTGDIVSLELAAVLALVLCRFLRWVLPRFRYLAWGDPE